MSAPGPTISGNRNGWRGAGFIDRGEIDELVCDMLRSEFFKRYAGRDDRSREHMAGLIRATPPVGLLTEILRLRACRQAGIDARARLRD